MFAIGAVAIASHLLDHLTVGVKSSVQFDAVVALGVVTVIAAVVYPRLPRGVQSMGSIVLGISWLTGDFFRHVLPMVRDGAQATDYTGLAATLGGVLLIGAGVAAALRSPGAAAEPFPGAGRREA